MDVSTLYSAICRCKWLIDPRQIDGHLVLIDQLLNHQLRMDKSIRSDKEDVVRRVSAQDGSMVVLDDFDEGPEGCTAIIPLQGTMMKYGTWCS